MSTRSALRERYDTVIVKELKEKYGYKNVHLIPKLEKVVINSALSADADKNWIAEVSKEIGLIAGQSPVVCQSRKSISNFKLRKGVPNGVKVTLRGERMYEFLYRLLVVALPLIRDFRGLKTRMDGFGNYTLGIQDHTIFPEITIDRDRKAVGMDITFVTTAKQDEAALKLLELFGFPFLKRTTRTAA